MATYLLLHGAGHDGWCWTPVGERLVAAGHVVVAPDLPCEDPSAGLDRYAQVAEAALDALVPGEAPVVVGHSLGALTAAVVAARRPVRGLVFVAGIVGAPGCSLQDLAAVDAARDVPLHHGDYETDDADRFRFTPAGGARALYHDCTPEVVREACDHLRFQRSLWTEVAPFDRWPDAPITSVVCRNDRIVDVGWARRTARDRLGIEPVELDGGHSPMLSRPDELAAVLAGR